MVGPDQKVMVVTSMPGSILSTPREVEIDGETEAQSNKETCSRWSQRQSGAPKLTVVLQSDLVRSEACSSLYNANQPRQRIPREEDDAASVLTGNTLCCALPVSRACSTSGGCHREAPALPAFT